MGFRLLRRNYQTVKEILPHIHVKAYSAIELDYVIRKSKLSYTEGLKKLKEVWTGLDTRRRC